MKVISKKNISVGLALVMACLILTSAKANTKNTEAPRAAAFVHSVELNEFVDDYFEEMEMIEDASPVTVKLYDNNDVLVFEGTEEDMDANIAKQFNQADFLNESLGSKYYKILH